MISFYKNLREKKNKKLLLKKYPSSDISLSARVDSNTLLEGYNVIKSGVDICGSKIGTGTVIGNRTALSFSCIGRFCSIANDVRVQPYTHPTNFISTNPIFFNTINNYPLGKGEALFQEILKTENGFYCEIGNDVWIGENVIIKGGVKIGNGAVVGMGAIVTNDVPPYSIVGGVPAKIIKYRFDQSIIQKLERIAWWDWKLNLIKKRKNDFTNVELFIKKYEKY